MNRFLQGLALIALAVAPAWGQNAKQQERILKQQAKLKAKQEKVAQKLANAPALERFLDMTPENREKELAKLPPERRQQVEQRLKQFQQLPPRLQDQLRGRFDAFMNLAPARRQVVRQELQTLRGLGPVARNARLNSVDMRDRFSPEELDILRGVSGQAEVR